MGKRVAIMKLVAAATLRLVFVWLPVIYAFPAPSPFQPPPHAIPFPSVGFTARVSVLHSYNTEDPTDRDCSFNATVYVDPGTASMRFDIDTRPAGISPNQYPCNNGPDDVSTSPPRFQVHYHAPCDAGDLANWGSNGVHFASD